MAASDINLQTFGLPLKPVPTVPTNLPTLVTATVDDLPGYFEADRLESVIVPEGWDIHFDVITEMKSKGCWENVFDLMAAAMDLGEAGAKFANKWNQTVEECFEGTEPRESIVELKLKKGMMTEWNEEMAQLKREMEMNLRLFESRARGKNLEHRVKECFEVHRNLGIDSNGEKWWEETVERLLDYGEQWTTASFTIQMWLSDLAFVIKAEGKIEEVRVYADVLCASFEQAEGMKVREELIFLIQDGMVGRKGNLAWTSTELGHVTPS